MFTTRTLANYRLYLLYRLAHHYRNVVQRHSTIGKPLDCRFQGLEVLRYLSVLLRKLIALFRKLITLFRKLITLFRKLITLFRNLITLFRNLIALFCYILVLLRNLLITIHYGCIAIFDCGEVLVLNIHVLTQLGVRGGGKQTTQNIHHVCVVLIIILVDVEHLAIALVLMGLVEHTKYLFKAVVHPAMKTWYLHYDAVVNQTFYKWIGNAFGYLIAILVVRLMYGINDRLFYVAHLMTKQVNRNHRYSELMRLFLADIVGIGILGTKILAET